MEFIKFKKYISFACVLVAALCLQSCEEDPVPTQQTKQQLILVYAVNNNNLSADLIANERGMLKALKDENLEAAKFLVYKYTAEGPGLFEAVNENGECSFKLIQQYDNTILSVTQERMSDVISTALRLYDDAEEYTLFFWGHGNGWVNPLKYTNASTGKSSTSASMVTEYLPDAQSFGGEYYYENGIRKSEYLDIDMMADAIPDHVFDLIWFDCCYMSSIEVAYQLRNKCKIMVAYPTEIMAEGLPYNHVLPKIIGADRNISEAADALYQYYTGKTAPEPVTVAVMDMSRIEEVADAAKSIFSLGESRPSVYELQNYSRFSGTPYYDAGQYLREYSAANNGGEESLKVLKDAFKNFVVFSAASDTDFSYPSGKPILSENFSGLSIHPYNGVNTVREDFYRSLDWYNRVWIK